MPRASARDTLLDAAETLYADQGVAAVSLRAINAAAGLSPAALHYHFPKGERLVEALVERRMPALMARREALLDRLADAGVPPTAHAVLEALALPLVEFVHSNGSEGRRYLRFMARLRADAVIDPVQVASRFPGGVDRILPLLQEALPGVPLATLRLRFSFALDLMLRALGDPDAHTGTGVVEGAALDDFVAALIEFLAGGLAVPVCGDAAKETHP